MVILYFADAIQTLNDNQGILAAISIVEAIILALVGGKALRDRITDKSRDQIRHTGNFIKAGGGVNAGGSITLGDVHNYRAAQPSEQQIAREVITYLEDKRVLYNASELESPVHCISAIIKIREFLTRKIKRLKDDDEISSELREMRSAARKFVDKAQDLDRHFGRGAGFDQEFFTALGEMRGVFSVSLKKISQKYGLKVEDELAKIFQPDDKGE